MISVDLSKYTKSPDRCDTGGVVRVCACFFTCTWASALAAGKTIQL